MIPQDSIAIDMMNHRIDGLSNSIDSLNNCLQGVCANVEATSNIVETANDSISNQLAASTIFFAVFSVIVGVLVLAAGWYIGWKKKQIDDVAKKIEDNKRLMQDIEKRTTTLDKQIKGDMESLYKKLQHEETKALLERLVLEPEDIANLLKPLLARELDEDNFELLRKAYLSFLGVAKNADIQSESSNENKKNEYKIEGNYYEGNISYLILLFQHYCYQSIKDDSIRPYLLVEMADVIECAFKRDIVKSTIQLCKALNKETSSFNKEEVLTTFLKGLNSSKHKNYIDLKNILEQNISPNTLLEKSIANCSTDKVYLDLFGVTPPDASHDKSETKES